MFSMMYWLKPEILGSQTLLTNLKDLYNEAQTEDFATSVQTNETVMDCPYL